MVLDENNPCDEPGCRLAPEVDRKLTEYEEAGYTKSAIWMGFNEAPEVDRKLTEYDRADQTESLMLIGVREADPVPTYATGKGPVA